MSQLKHYTVRVVESFQTTVIAESEAEAKQLIAEKIPKHSHPDIGENQQRKHHFRSTRYVTPSGALSDDDPDYLRRCLGIWRERADEAARNLDRALCMSAPIRIKEKYEFDMEHAWERVCSIEERLAPWGDKR